MIAICSNPFLEHAISPISAYITTVAVSLRLTFARIRLLVLSLVPMPNMAVERDGLQAALAGALRASRSGRPSPLR